MNAIPTQSFLKRWLRLPRSLLQWAAVGSLLLIVVPFILFPLALLGPASKQARSFFYRCSSGLCKTILRLFGARIQVTGAWRKNLAAPAIIIMNHTSALDIPVLEALLDGSPFTWFSKASYTAIPFGGTILKRMHIAVERSRATSAVKSLKQFVEKAESYRAHMLIFPEGTRSADGTLQRFKPGFALAAETTGRPIVPVVAQDVHRILSKHGFLIDSSVKTIKITVGEPLVRMVDEPREAFVQRTHDQFQALLAHQPH